MNPLAHPVLELLLEHHPGLLSVDEVIRHIAPDPADCAQRDDVLIAVRELTEAGLAHRIDQFVFASGAASAFASLDLA